MPSFTLGLGVAAVMARFTRSAFVEIAREDYVRTARAKGVPEKIVIWKHTLRNALVPVITMTGLQFGFLLGGSFVVETVFSWPGLGRLSSIGLLSRLSGDPGGDPAVLAGVHLHQPRGGRALRLRQSGDPLQMSAATSAPASAAPRACARR